MGAAKAAKKKTTTEKKARPRKKKAGAAEAASRGLTAGEVAGEEPEGGVRALAAQIAEDGGAVLATYRDPLGGAWQVLASLPLDRVEPTPFQRDLSDTHVQRLSGVIARLDRFLDPIIAVRTEEGRYWTPNGNHRLAAMKRLGARSIVALVLPELDIAFQILALNTEKAHNVREKALEVIRMARALAERGDKAENAYEGEFEEAPLLTLGLCYEENGRFSGGAYHPVLRRVDALLDLPLSESLEVRKARAEKLLALDAAVGDAVRRLKASGFDSPFLKPYVIARINPLRFKRGATDDFDEVIGGMTRAAEKFDAAKISKDELRFGGGAGGGEGEDSED